jgi:uncharacterized protein
MRRKISFTSKHLRCVGWLYKPDDLAKGQKAPAIVMAHGFSAVKEMYLDRFAERFVAAGFVTLVFDYRHFGESDGEPRGQLFPFDQHEDYRNALTWLSDQPEVDPKRVGAWGSSLSGAHVIYLGSVDRRIKAVAAQVPGVMNVESRRAMDPQRFEQFGRFLLGDRIGRYNTGAVNYMKVVAPQGESCALPPTDAYEWFMEAGKIAPNWFNGVTLESLELTLQYDPAHNIQFVAPTPLLMIVAEHDSLIPMAVSIQSYERARDPKKMILLPCGHFDVYHKEPWFSKTADAEVEWFTRYL